MKLVICFCPRICTYTLTRARACMQTQASYLLIRVEQASGSNWPVDKNMACFCVLDEPFEVGRSVQLSFSPTEASCGECDLSSASSCSEGSTHVKHSSDPRYVPFGQHSYLFINVCEAQEAGGYGPSTSALNLTNVMSENGSPSWNTTGKGGVISPLPST